MIIYYHKMENLINLEIVKRNENLLKGRIFTDLQLNVLKKKLQKKPLDINEKTYYYKYIKPKIKAMFSFFNIDEINIRGKEQILKKRIPKAMKILNHLNKKHKNKKIMISGSYLFNKNYNDIDAFIFTKYDKEDYKKGKTHVNFLPEKSLNSLFFNSLSQISISNFSYISKKEFDINLNKILQLYEFLINYIFNEEGYQKELRTFLLETEYVSKKVILNPEQLYNLRKKIKQQNIIKIISLILINTLVISYKKNKLNSLKRYITDYTKLLKQYKQSKNLNTYIQTYKQVIKIGR